MTPSHEPADCRSTVVKPHLLDLCGRGVFCYGAGAKGRIVASMLQAEGVEVHGFIERDPREPINGLSVYGLHDECVAQAARSGCVAVVSVFNFSSSAALIHDALSKVGFERIIGFGELRQTISVPDTYWLAETDKMTPSQNDAEWLRCRLADDVSRNTLESCLEARACADMTRFSQPCLENQYFPEDIPLPRRRIHYVDVGAYHGETIVALVAAGFDLSQVTAFEPDRDNFKSLLQAVKDLPNAVRVYLYPCGLSDDHRFVRFDPRGVASSLCPNAGEETAMLVALDQVMPGATPTYMKFDIEGGEAAALSGASDIIRRSRPALAIAVYHRPEDLWQLPRLVDDLLPGCRFYLRLHGHHGFELVLYAVPT